MHDAELKHSSLLETKTISMLSGIGVDSNALSIQQCGDGKNNRCYKVITSENTYLLKHYFKNKHDLRNRLLSEKLFIEYANEVAPSFVPMIRSVDKIQGMILFDYINGESISQKTLCKSDIDQALLFFKQLNTSDTDSQKLKLPIASEACFSFREHVALIDNRLKRLRSLSQVLAIDKERDNTIRRVEEQWDRLIQNIESDVYKAGLSYSDELQNPSRCISPSDFGFHNAVREKNGQIKFIDFEYAGWDDPAKMAADFFCQLAVPIPMTYYKDFLNKAMSCFIDSSQLIRRAEILLPLYKIKWCCIVLNIFLPTHLDRRQFANVDLNEIELKRHQISKAELILDELIHLR